MPSEPDDPHAGDGASPDQAIDKAAALDDYVGGFAAELPSGAASELRDEGSFSGVLDLMLLLRQAAAVDAPFAATASAMPASIGRYRILGLAGRGGFSVVWQAYDPVLRRRVAVKVCAPDAMLSPSSNRRFRREAELASRLVHPHIVTIHEVGEDGGQPFIVTEFCEGGTLADWLARHPGPVAPGVAARITLAIARAAGHAHDAGIIHRDIKPANVLLVPTAAGDLAATLVPPDPASATPGMTIKLGDFGLGRQESSSEGEDPLTQLTASGARLGTPAWMAPEQVDRSFGDIGPATDVHGIGLLLHRMLAGRPLRGGKTELETYREVLLDEPVPANRVVRGISADLAAVTSRCLAKRPEHRYLTAAALVDDLDRWLAGVPTKARPVSAIARLSRSIVRHPGVALLTIATVAATVAAVWAVRQQSAERTRAIVREDALAKQRAAASLQQGFEAVRAGNIAAAIDKLARTRAIDPGLATSFAGRWLERRTHGERDILLTTAASSGRPADLHCIAVSPSGDTAAIGGADGRLWLVRGIENKPFTAVIEAHDEINDVCFSPNGHLIATVGQDGWLRWWRIDEAAGRIEPAGQSPCGTPLYAVSFTADGRSLLYGGEDRVLRSVSVAGHEPPLEVYEFSPVRDARPEIEAITPVTDQRAAVACGATIVIIDTATGRVLCEMDRANLDLQPPVIHGLGASPEGTRLVAAGSDRIPRIWDIDSGKVVAIFPPHPNWIYACRFSPDGHSIVTACRDGVGRVFDVKTGDPQAKFIGHSGRIWDVAFDGQGFPLTAGADGTVRRWSLIGLPGEVGLTDVPVFGPGVTMIEEMADGGSPRLLVMRNGGPGLLVTLDGSPPIEPACGAVRGSSTFAQDQPRNRLAFGVLDQSDRTMPTVKSLQDGADMPLVPPADGMLAAGPAVAWTPDGRLVTCSRDGHVLAWSPSLDAVVAVGRTLPPWIALAAATTMPPRFAICGAGGQVFTLAPDGRLAGDPMRLPLPDSRVSAVCWSPNGRLVACGTHDGGVHVFDGASGVLLGSLAPHPLRIQAITFTPDGRILLTADFDRLRISDTATFQTFDEVVPGWMIRAVFASADGDRVVIGGEGSHDQLPEERARLAIFELDAK